MPLKARMTMGWSTLFLLVSFALLFVMLTNLWDEYPRTVKDLYVIGSAVALPLVTHVVFFRGVSVLRMPVLCVLYPAYIGSIAGTLICWQYRYGIFNSTP
jgi:hypothetical protein